MREEHAWKRRTLIKSAGVAGLLLGTQPAIAHAAGRSALDRADELFRKGEFEAADAIYRRHLAHAPDHVHALAQHAYITVLANRLPQAKGLLKRVLRLDPHHARSLSNLANVLWRRDEFDELAALLPRVKLDPPAGTPEQLRSFGRRRAYEISGPAVTRIPFIATDSLPMVEVSLNGSEPAVFFIDTGGTFALNQDYAEAQRIPMYGYTRGKTMYGEHKNYQGRVDLLTLGDLDIRRLPVHTIPNEIRLTAPDGRPTNGVIGTSVLARFLSTIDYPGRALVLRRRRERIPDAITMPMWLLGDHYLLARGSVNHLDSMMFFVDTGGGDIGFTAPRSTFTAAGVPVPPGDGTHPVTLDRVTLGEATRRNVPGLIGAFPDWFEDGFGFHIGGLPTHEFFKPYGLTFDFPRMRIHLTR